MIKYIQSKETFYLDTIIEDLNKSDTSELISLLLKESKAISFSANDYYHKIRKSGLFCNAKEADEGFFYLNITQEIAQAFSNCEDFFSFSKCLDLTQFAHENYTPELEDLCFYDNDDNLILETVSHENFLALNVKLYENLLPFLQSKVRYVNKNDVEFLSTKSVTDYYQLLSAMPIDSYYDSKKLCRSITKVLDFGDIDDSFWEKILPNSIYSYFQKADIMSKIRTLNQFYWPMIYLLESHFYEVIQPFILKHERFNKEFEM